MNKLLARPQEWTFSDAAGRGEDRWTANYDVDAEAEILAISTDPSMPPSVVNKPLRVSGTAAFTKQGQPEEVQVSRIEALPDDPNPGIWAVLNSTGFGHIDLIGSLDPAVFAASVQSAQAAQSFTLPPEIFQAMAKGLRASQNVTPAADPTREFPDPEASSIDPVPDDDEGTEEGPRRSA